MLDVNSRRLLAFGCVFSLLNICNSNFYAMNDQENHGGSNRISNCKLTVPLTSEADRNTFCSGCELLSIVNLLKYHNLDINPQTFFDKYFIHQDWKLIDDKIISGAPQPYIAYPGDPKIPSKNNCGFGCFAPVIKFSLLRYFISNNITRYNIVVEKNISTDNLIVNYVSKNIPVVIWCTQPRPNSDFSEPVKLKEATQGSTWEIYHSEEIEKIYKSLSLSLSKLDIDVNKITALNGQNYSWIRGEHCTLLIGETEQSYILNDPFLGEIHVDKESLNKSREIFGNQMVALLPIINFTSTK